MERFVTCVRPLSTDSRSVGHSGTGQACPPPPPLSSAWAVISPFQSWPWGVCPAELSCEMYDLISPGKIRPGNSAVGRVVSQMGGPALSLLLVMLRWCPAPLRW